MIQKKYLASLDQSTTTTKFSLFLFDGTLVDQQILTHKQISDKQGWLEHNPSQILHSVESVIKTVINRQNSKLGQGFSTQQILGLGLCNQRQTVVCFDSESKKPLCNAIVWSDARTKNICQQFTLKYGNKFNKITGLPVSTYFTLFKILWLLQNIQGLKQKVKQNKVKFATIDSWVALHLTGQFVTDASNASRTHLMNIQSGKWDEQLLKIAQINQNCLPTIINSFQVVGNIITTDMKGVPLSCILGDQQSSAYAHNLNNDQMKITYGTGCFLLSNIGNEPKYKDAFVTTVMYQKQQKRSYGYEISVECGGGTINWAKKLGFYENYNQLNNLNEYASQIYFMPSFGSIFSPFWKSNVQGGIIGLNFKTQRKQILKSILDSITFRLNDNIKSEEFKKVKKIIVDGGMTVNKQFMQAQADMFQKQIEVRSLDTCWGVAKGVLTTNKIQIQVNKIKLNSTLYLPKIQNFQIYNKSYEKWYEVRNKFYGWNK